MPSVPWSLFLLKWQLIRDRLNRLHAGLVDITIAGAQRTGACDAFVCLLHDVAATAREALGLVPHSQGRHYGDGKLRLCSDLDVLAAAFDARLEEVYASGVLARVVARPSASQLGRRVVLHAEPLG
jgi:hypothetical protein